MKNMSKIFWNLSKVAPVLLGASLLVNNSPVSAQSVDRTLEQIEQYNQQAPSNSNGQVTSVNQLRDVAPTDWSFEALQSLVERYGCIAGFPNQTYRGNKPLSRYEFAAGLNACLNQIERLIASSESVMREDLDKINRLSEEFQAELATLGTRVDNLEGRTAFLEDHQFSTTTKLKGKAIFGLSGSFGQDNKATLAGGNGNGGAQTDDQITFSDRVRLNFETSFKGKDVLRTRLQAANVPNLATSTGVDAARLGYEGSDKTNDIVLDDLWYKFPVGSKITAWVGPNALNLDDVFDTNNPYFESNETGTVTRFARYNPLVYRGTDGAGAAAKYEFSKQLNLTLAYLADGTSGSTTTGAANPSESNGLFSGAYTGAAQIGFSPTENLKLSATYAHSYQPRGRVNLTGGTGDNTIDSQFSDAAAVAAGVRGASADRFGLQASFKLGSRFNIGGWAGYAKADSEGGDVESDVYTAALNLAILDIGKEGSVIGLTGGIPPYADRDNEEIPIFVEGLYKYPINDKISITPSVYAIFNPNSNDNNDTVLVGTLRTTFEF
jgi:hypothetical protein